MYFNRHEFMDKQIMHQSCDVLQLDSVHAHFDISIWSSFLVIIYSDNIFIQEIYILDHGDWCNKE